MLRTLRHYSSFKPPHLRPQPNANTTDYAELNEFYSDLFTGDTDANVNVNANTVNTTESEINELNREMAELYGADLTTDPVTEPASLPEVQPQEPQEPALSLSQRLQSRTPLIIRSRSTSPFFNLALEDKIFELTPRPLDATTTTSGTNTSIPSHRLILYTNSPAVIMGKNQNPHKETSLPLLAKLGVPLIRRFSGGGTVVHDLGNVNYCYITGREQFLRGEFNGGVVAHVNAYLSQQEQHKHKQQGLTSSGEEEERRRLAVNERGDIVMLLEGEGGDSDATEYKVSGSAYRISKGKAYHHGTMLLASNLTMLRELLKKNTHVSSVVDSSVDSVRSKVRNVGLQSDEFVRLVSEAFSSKMKEEGQEQEGLDTVVEVLEVDEQHVEELELSARMEKLKSWDWSIAATPAFQITYVYHLAGVGGGGGAAAFDAAGNPATVEVSFKVKRNGILESFSVQPNSWTSQFEMLQLALDSGEEVKFKGDVVPGFIMDEKLGAWLSDAIDGSEV
jgi:lipoate-protein ligase A